MSLGSERAEALKNAEFYKDACIHMNEEVCQVLGKVLGFPWFKDDQKNFPGATEKDGICQGEYTCESMADLAAAEIIKLRKAIKYVIDSDRLDSAELEYVKELMGCVV